VTAHRRPTEPPNHTSQETELAEPGTSTDERRHWAHALPAQPDNDHLTDSRQAIEPPSKLTLPPPLNLRSCLMTNLWPRLW
jgi:hypothetical protein